MTTTLCAMLLSSAAGLTLPQRPATAPRPTVTTCGRRAALLQGTSLLAVTAVMPPLPAGAEPLSASRMLSARQYIVDLKEAINALDQVRPLLERRDVGGYDAARQALRKQPVFGIRKACSKILIVLEGDERLKAKTKDCACVPSPCDRVPLRAPALATDRRRTRHR